MLFGFLIVLIAIIAVLLTLVVLLQSGKGGGLAGLAAGGTQQVLGARQAPDVLEKASWTLGAMFIVLCILTNFAIDDGGAQESILREGAPAATEQPVLPPAGETAPAPAPATPAPEGQ